MAGGERVLVYAAEGLSHRAANLLDWHLDNGTSANWLARVLEEGAGKIGVTTLKAWRSRINRPSLHGRDGMEQPALEYELAEKQAKMQEKQLREVTPRVLILDIERMSALIQTRVWSASSLKGRYIPADWVLERDRTICWAAKWHGSDEVMFAAEWEEGGQRAMLEKAWDLFDQADIVVGHNLQGFDRKHLNGEWALIGKPKPSPYKVVDTLLVARREFHFMHNSLDALCRLFGVPNKTDKYDVGMALAALEGDEDAQNQLRSYNEGDILATDALYSVFRFRGWISTHPIMAPGFPYRCQNCQSKDMERLPKPYVARVMVYEQHRCRDCGVVHRERIGSRATDLRPVSSY